MEAQAAAQAAAQAVLGQLSPAAHAQLGQLSPAHAQLSPGGEGAPVSPHSDEPTDLTTVAGREREERERERQERERYYTQLMERYNIERSSPSRYTIDR